MRGAAPLAYLVDADAVPALAQSFGVELARADADRSRVKRELGEYAEAHAQTKSIRMFLFHDGFPVDIRHNAKIFREKLALWAERALA